MGSARTVGAYLLDTSEGLSLFDCGPTSCLPALKAGLAERGHELGDVKRLLLSHIHLDHAGAAGVLVREHPGADRLGLGDRRAAPRRPVSARAQRATALRRHVRRAVGRARTRARGERPDREQPRRRAGGLPRAGPCLPPRLLLRRHDALRGRRGRRADPAEPDGAAADAAAGRRHRGLVPHVRGDRAARSGAAGADPLRARKRRQPAPRRAARAARHLGGPGRGRSHRAGVRRRRPKPTCRRRRPTSTTARCRSGSPTRD